MCFDWNTAITAVQMEYFDVLWLLREVSLLSFKHVICRQQQQQQMLLLLPLLLLLMQLPHTSFHSYNSCVHNSPVVLTALPPSRCTHARARAHPTVYCLTQL